MESQPSMGRMPGAPAMSLQQMRPGALPGNMQPRMPQSHLPNNNTQHFPANSMSPAPSTGNAPSAGMPVNHYPPAQAGQPPMSQSAMMMPGGVPPMLPQDGGQSMSQPGSQPMMSQAGAQSTMSQAGTHPMSQATSQSMPPDATSSMPQDSAAVPPGPMHSRPPAPQPTASTAVSQQMPQAANPQSAAQNFANTPPISTGPPISQPMMPQSNPAMPPQPPMIPQPHQTTDHHRP